MFTRLTIYCLCILTICVLVISRFDFEDGTWVLIAPNPGHCILVSFVQNSFFLKTDKTYLYIMKIKIFKFLKIEIMCI